MSIDAGGEFMSSNIVATVAQKTGLSQQQAQSAVDAVVGVLKSKLPAPVASQIDAVLAGGAPTGGTAGVAGKIGSMFGKKE